MPVRRQSTRTGSGPPHCRGANTFVNVTLLTHSFAVALNQVLPNGNLVFPPFRAEDYRQEVHAQVYVCLARNPVGSVHSRDVNVRAGP